MLINNLLHWRYTNDIYWYFKKNLMYNSQEVDDKTIRNYLKDFDTFKEDSDKIIDNEPLLSNAKLLYTFTSNRTYFYLMSQQ